MATGIVALAMNAAGEPTTGRILFGIGAASYATLWGLLLARGFRDWPALRADFTSHARAPGFLSIVAATAVLGSGCVLLFQSPEAGSILWIAAFVLWCGLSYALLAVLMEREHKPVLDNSLSGVWLLIVVATQSVCVLGCLVIPRFAEPWREPASFAALGFWFVGGMLYIWLIALIFFRMMFRPLSAADLTPPYWINMGAMAISTLAGTLLISSARGAPLLLELLPFLKGLTLMFWATASWWLPLLLLLGAWRHGVKRYPVVYDHSYWGAVFPLGMYSVCTIRLAGEFGLPFLAPIGEAFAWISLAAWLAAAIGLVRGLLDRGTATAA